ncbi:hypothetical protein PV417_30510 [Streptomyces sp. ME19-03-3]|nr:hypothetical protein [Streptomyces sp. ME19-03-3]
MQSVSPGRPRLRRVRLPGTVSLPALPRTGDPHSGHRAGDKPARGTAGGTDVRHACRAGLSTTDPFPDGPQPFSEAPSIG